MSYRFTLISSCNSLTLLNNDVSKLLKNQNKFPVSNPALEKTKLSVVKTTFAAILINYLMHLAAVLYALLF